MPASDARTLLLAAACVAAPLWAQPPLDLFLPPFDSPPTPPNRPTFIDGVTTRFRIDEPQVVDPPMVGDGRVSTTRRTDTAVWADAAPLLTANLKPRTPELWTDDAFRSDGPKRVARSKTGGGWGTHSAKIELRERDLGLLDPVGPQSWETGEKLKMPVAGPWFAFAQLDASSPSVEQQQHRWVGKYGVGLTVKPWILDEVSFRGGPALRYDDTGPPLRGNSPERSEVFVEAATKVPLPVLGALEVEWTGYAVPAASTAERNVLNQDLRLAKPLGGGSEVYMGARYRWEDAPGATPWVDRAQLYLGVQLKR